MPTYVALIKLTDQGVKSIKDIKKAQEEAHEGGEKAGVKIKGIYWLMGEYDIVTIIEAPSDEIAVSGSIFASSDGNIRSSTYRAFTNEEFWGIISKLP